VVLDAFMSITVVVLSFVVVTEETAFVVVDASICISVAVA